MVEARRGVLIAVIVASVFGAVLLVRQIAPTDGPNGQGTSAALSLEAAAHGHHGPYTRIISMAPSITEVLFALNLGDRVVGVTRYCTYPPEVREKEKIGGFLDPSYEAIVALSPDLIILLPIHSECANRLDRLGIKHLTVDQTKPEHILESIVTIGDACGAPERAKTLVAQLRTRITEIEKRIAGLPKPSVLMSIGRDLSFPALAQVSIAGKNAFFDAMLEIAGGVNVFTEEGISYPILSAEGILRLNPDVIIELAPDTDNAHISEAGILEAWKTLPGVNAVKNDRLHILSGGYIKIPGPRFVQIAEDLARILHPELEEAAG